MMIDAASLKKGLRCPSMRPMASRPKLGSRRAARRFGLFLTPDFSAFSVSCFVQPFRVANQLSSEKLYEWETISLDSTLVQASNGLSVRPDRPVSDLSAVRELRLTDLVICDGSHRRGDERVIARLRGLSRHGTRIGAISSGTWVLAHAGLLQGRPCTIHWEELEAFRSAFPELSSSSNLFEVDEACFTCAGGAAALDLALHLVAEHAGRPFALQVSERLVLGRMRTEDESQRFRLADRLAVTNTSLLRAVEIMESNLEFPRSLDQIVVETKATKRSLQRLFRKHLQQTPLEYYMSLRLRLGRQLLQQTSMPVIEIALACGFRTPSHFCQRYRRFFGCSPSEDRRRSVVSGDRVA